MENAEEQMDASFDGSDQEEQINISQDMSYDQKDVEVESHTSSSERTPSSTAHTPLLDEPNDQDSEQENYLSPEDVTFQPAHRSSLKRSPHGSPELSSHYVTARSAILPHSSHDVQEEEQLDYDEELPSTTNISYSDDVTPKKSFSEHHSNPIHGSPNGDVSSGCLTSSSSSEDSDEDGEQSTSEEEEGECESSDHSSGEDSCANEVEEGELSQKRRKSKKLSQRQKKKDSQFQHSEKEEGECEMSDAEPAANTPSGTTDKTAQTGVTKSLAIPSVDEAGDEDPWLKAVRLAKERMKKAKELKQSEKDLDEKKLNMNLMDVEEVNVPKPLTESKAAKLISNTVTPGAQSNADGKMPIDSYFPIVPKKNDMLLEYYLYSIADQENWRFIGADLNEVSEWQRRDYNEEWLKQFTRLSLHGQKKTAGDADGEGHRKRRRHSRTSTVSSRSGTRSSSSSRSHSRGSSSSRSRSSSRSSAANSSSSSSVVSSRSSSVSTSSSVSSIGHRRGRRPPTRRNNERPDPATIYRSLHARTTLADLRHPTKPGGFTNRRSPPLARDNRSPSSERHNRYPYNQNRRAGNRPSPVYSPSGRKRAPIPAPDTTTSAATDQSTTVDKKPVVSGHAAAIDPQLEARLNQWRAQPGPAGGIDDQQWRDPWERRSKAAPGAAGQPAGLKPPQSRSPMDARSGTRPTSASSSRSSSSNSSAGSHSSASSGSSSRSSSSSGSGRSASVKSAKDSGARRSLSAVSQARSGSGSSGSESGSSSGSGSPSGVSRSSSSSASPRRVMDPKISGSTSALRRQVADSTVNISPGSRVKLGLVSDEHIVSSSTQAAEEKLRPTTRPEVKMHLPTKKRNLVMGRSVAQLEDDSEEENVLPRPPAPTLHMKSGLPLPVATSPSLPVTKPQPSHPSMAQVEAAAAAISKSHEAEKKKTSDDHRSRHAPRHDKQPAAFSELYRKDVTRPSKHKILSLAEDMSTKHRSHGSREKHSKRSHHEKSKHNGEVKEEDKRSHRDESAKKIAVRGRHSNSNQSPHHRHHRVAETSHQTESFDHRHTPGARPRHMQDYQKGNAHFSRGGPGEFDEMGMNYPRGAEKRRSSGMGRPKISSTGSAAHFSGTNENEGFRRTIPPSNTERRVKRNSNNLEWREVPASSTGVMGSSTMEGGGHKHRRQKDQEEYPSRPTAASRIPTRSVHPSLSSRPGVDAMLRGRGERDSHPQSGAAPGSSKRTRDGAGVRGHSPERQSGQPTTNVPSKPAESGTANAGEKKAVKRREELLQQLAMVEDAIAKKRAKMSGSSLIR